jgi:hypothetical protein
MDSAFCPRCGSTVEDKDGYCLLGHPLPQVNDLSDLAGIRREVDEAFEESWAGFEPVLESVGAARGGPPPPPPERTSRYLPPEDPIAAFAPAPRMDWGPPQAPLRRLFKKGPRGEE